MNRNANGIRSKKRKLESVQTFIPVKNICRGVIETTDSRYIRILEIEPLNFVLRSPEEQHNIISTFAGWLKISPIRLQFKSITGKADSERYVDMIRKDMSKEKNGQCRYLGEDYIRLIKDIGNREALTRRFFLIFEYEAVQKDTDNSGHIYGTLQMAEQNARTYFTKCGNSIVQQNDPDEETAEILYMFFNRRSCITEPFRTRIERVVMDAMVTKNLTVGIDPVPEIPMVDFISPRGIDFTHYNYVVMDGMYYCYLYIRGNGYPGAVHAGWVTSLVNAGEGVDVDVHLRKENRSRTIDKVAQRIRLNKTKIKNLQDTSTDYEELSNSIQAGYYIKQGISSYNEDLFYMSVFITISAKEYGELTWRRQQVTDMLKSMDITVSECRFQQEAAFKSTYTLSLLLREKPKGIC